ncbi:hypothetical protein Tco_0651782 [Tanacetum coccineum]|uniref:Protein kinase-like domain, concanavalin A-like lectin/glucanase domain protein n=1 Tax=Tanacetum coccineum TaxID=301880 RepID=A0ABQ4WVR5_9ASTR
MIGKIYLLWKTVSEKLNDVSTSKNAENSMAYKSITEISHDEREELRKNGIKIPSKLFSPKYLSSASIKKLRQEYNSMLESLGLVPQSSNTKFVCSKEDDGEVMFIEIIQDDDEPQNEGPDEGRIKGMHVFVGNFTYFIDFIIVEDISSIIDPRLSQMVLGRPFIEISNMTYDLPEGVVRFTNENDEVAYKMPHKIEQYNSLLNLEKEHTKSVYLRNEEDKRRGVDYIMSKILGFYKECLELGPEYVTGLDDEGEVT